MFDPSTFGGSGGGDFTGGGSNDSGGSVFDTGTTGFNDFGLGSSGGGGSSAADSASTFMDTGGSSFTDSSGSFATGGSFIVGGDGGTDTTKVTFMATKGETVTIKPPGSNDNFNAGHFATGGAFTVGGAITTNAASPFAPAGQPILGEASQTVDLLKAAISEDFHEQTSALLVAIHESGSSIVATITAGDANIAAAVATLQGSISSVGSMQASSQSIGSSAIAASTGSGPVGKTIRWNALPDNYPGNVQPVENNYLGGFATGGSFVVGGDGGTDTTKVEFMATKGEEVTIKPPPGVPGSGATFDAGHFATGGTFTVPGSGSSSTVTVNPASLPGASQPGTKTVNIIVQQGVQADTFIRSRAQIQRAMG